MKPVRVLIVDDSRTMRMLIASVLQRDPDIEVVGEASDPLEARQAIKSLDPDVVTLDVEMPNMNGLDFLEKLMRLRPMPVIMISNLTSHGAETTIRALEIGAFDCVPKPSSDTHEFADLADKVRAAAHARDRIMSRHKAHLPIDPETAPRQSYQSDGRVVAIGSSTGGVEALITVLSRFPLNCPPTVIVQHMPATFTGNFAQRLNRICPASVAEAFDGAPLAPGHVFLARGGIHMEISGRPGSLRCRLHEREPGERAPPVGRCAVYVGRKSGRRQGARRHSHRHGPGRRGRSPADAAKRRRDARPGRGEFPRLWHAEIRIRAWSRRHTTPSSQDRERDLKPNLFKLGGGSQCLCSII